MVPYQSPQKFVNQIIPCVCAPVRVFFGYIHHLHMIDIMKWS